MGFNPNKTLTINPNKTLGITQTVITKVTATFSVDPLASPNTFPPQQVVANTQQVISPGSPVKDGFIFTGWLPSLPATISQNTTFVAQFETDTGTTPAPLQTLTPSTGTVGVTADSVTFSITNNDPAPSASITWVIRLGSETGTPAASGTETVNSGQTVQVSATGLSSETSYWLTGVRATAPTKTQSGEAAFRVLTTNPLPQTATPETAVSSVTTNSVTFRIRNLDANIASISWLIRQGTETGTIVNSGTNTNVGSNVDVFPTATGLSSGVVYWLTNITAQASGKTTSQPGINRSTTTSTTTTTTTTTASPQTAQPSFSNISSTSNSISFRANNNDALSVSMQVSNNTLSTFLFNGTVASNNFTTISESGLSPGTTYTYQITAQASGKTSNSVTQNISTSATTTTTTTTTTAAPTTTTTTTTTTAAPTTTTTTTTASPTTANPTVTLSNQSGALGVFIKNNDSATVSLSYSGSALNVVSGLPSTLSAGATFSNTYFVFGNETYQLCAIATASGKASSSQICSSVFIN